MSARPVGAKIGKFGSSYSPICSGLFSACEFDGGDTGKDFAPWAVPVVF